MQSTDNNDVPKTAYQYEKYNKPWLHVTDLSESIEFICLALPASHDSSIFNAFLQTVSHSSGHENHFFDVSMLRGKLPLPIFLNEGHGLLSTGWVSEK